MKKRAIATQSGSVEEDIERLLQLYPTEILEEMCCAMSLTEAVEEGQLEVLNYSLYQNIRCRCPDRDRTFLGSAGGIMPSLGISISRGHLFSVNVPRLMTDAVSFVFLFGSSYSALVFFDLHRRQLGSFRGPPLRFVGGGGGQGDWISARKNLRLCTD